MQVRKGKEIWRLKIYTYSARTENFSGGGKNKNKIRSGQDISYCTKHSSAELHRNNNTAWWKWWRGQFSSRWRRKRRRSQMCFCYLRLLKRWSERRRHVGPLHTGRVQSHGSTDAEDGRREARLLFQGVGQSFWRPCPSDHAVNRAHLKFLTNHTTVAVLFLQPWEREQISLLLRSTYRP